MLVICAPGYVRISAAGHWKMANDVPKQRPFVGKLVGDGAVGGLEVNISWLLTKEKHACCNLRCSLCLIQRNITCKHFSRNIVYKHNKQRSYCQSVHPKLWILPPKTYWFHPKALVPKHPELGQHTKGWSDWPSATPPGVELESSGLGSSRPAILFCGEI